MKRIRIFLSLLFALASVGLMSCQPEAGDKTSTTSPVLLQPDDIVPTPGGLTYRANFHQEGKTNPWTSIVSTEVVLGDANDPLRISYRNYIETKAGQVRNDILTFYLPNVDPNDRSLKAIEPILGSDNLPSGIALSRSTVWHGGDPARRAQTVLRIEISSELKSDYYTFDIKVVINGRDYGTVPCTLKVLAE